MSGKGQVALVTGSGTGIGRSAALMLADRGYDIVVNYSRSADDAARTVQDIENRGVRAIAIQADVADDNAVRRMVERTVDQFGGLNVLVNNAATTHFIDHTDLESVTEHVWNDILNVNVKGLFSCCRAAMPYLAASTGRIVNVASVAGIAGSGSSIPYAASKGAVITLTKSLAKAFAPNVRVNAVAPGPVQTRWLADHQDMVESAMRLTPLGRPATPDDIAEAIVFLADVTTLMTGQVVVLDGGRTI
ncbi:SDR family oxidoreductase [bacterium]|nr:SDR family oxidoreductase [bacterium]